MIEHIDWGTPVFLRRLRLIAAIAARARAAESQSAPGVSDTQIKIGQTIAYMRDAVEQPLARQLGTAAPQGLDDRGRHMDEVAMLIPGITLYATPTDYHAIKQMRLKRFDGARRVPLGGVISE